MKVSFKLKCGKAKREFYWCHLFSTKAEMQKWNDKDNGFAMRGNYLGMVRHYKRLIQIKGRWRISPNLGAITFCLDRIGSGIVAHEMNHAALFWFRFKYKYLALLYKTKYFEKLADVDGDLNLQFWTHWYRLEKQGRIKKLERAKL